MKKVDFYTNKYKALKFIIDKHQESEKDKFTKIYQD